MKRKILCFTLSVLLVFSVCATVLMSVGAAASYSLVEKADKNYTVTDGVDYSEYTITSGENGNFVTAHALSFNVDDYAVISYSGTAGGSGTLDEQYAAATAAGYEVVAVINGDFFSMDSGSTPNGNYGYLNEYVVSNGVIINCDADNSASDFDGVVAISGDGTITSTPSSKIHFNMYFNGVEINSGLGKVNKTSGKNSAANWGDQFYYFDEYSGDLHYAGNTTGMALTYECCPGYEVLCKKINGTQLTIGGTLEAEVISVTPDTYGGKIGQDEFILFVKSTSPMASYAAELKAGDSVAISASEAVEAASAITTNATSIMANVGWLVKDGVDQTQIKSTIGSHSVTLEARWTVFGTKEDGSWVFMTTEGADTGSNGSVTLRDVAKAMIELGCTNVVRMDGGGSTAMYLCNDGTGVSGFKQNQGRDVGDCVLLVKRTGKAIATDEVKTSVNDLITEANAAEKDSYVTAALNNATSVVSNEKSLAGDYTIAYMNLRYALSGKNALGELMSLAAGINYTDYSEYVLDNLRTAYTAASAAFGGTGDAEEIQAAYDELKKWYDLSGNVTIDGTEYTTVTSGFYLTGMNLSILSGYCCIYTPGTDVSVVNLKWSQVTMLKWDDNYDAYIIVKNFFGGGDNNSVMTRLGFENNVVPEGYIVIGTHGDTGTPALANRTTVAKGKAGQALYMHGIDLETRTVGIGAYLEFGEAKSKLATGDVDGNGAVEAKDYLKLKRYVLGTYTPADGEVDRMDVNNDSNVNAKDYIMLKRVVLGTYSFT